jgi:hypothetical protein
MSRKITKDNHLSVSGNLTSSFKNIFYKKLFWILLLSSIKDKGEKKWKMYNLYAARVIRVMKEKLKMS